MASFETQAELFKALSHPSRLLILGLCRQRSRHTEELAGLLQTTVFEKIAQGLLAKRVTALR